MLDCGKELMDGVTNSSMLFLECHEEIACERTRIYRCLNPHEIVETREEKTEYQRAIGGTP